MCGSVYRMWQVIVWKEFSSKGENDCLQELYKVSNSVWT